MTDEESVYADELRRLGFIKGMRAEPIEDDEGGATHACTSDAEFIQLFNSNEPFFHYFRGHTVAFDEMRNLWIAHAHVDLSGIRFRKWRTSADDNLVPAQKTGH